MRTVIFAAKLTWIAIKYLPILFAWIVAVLVAVPLISDMFNAFNHRPEFTLIEQIVLIAVGWIVITAIAAIKIISK